MNLVKTTVFRVAIQFAAVFASLSVVTLLSVYYFTIYEIEIQAENELLHELKTLESHYEEFGYESLLNLVKLRDQYGRHLYHYYALLKDDQYVEGSEFMSNKIGEVDYERYGVEFYYVSEFINNEGHEVIIKFAKTDLSLNVKLIVGQAQNSLTELREHTFIALIYAVIITIFLALFIGIYMGRSVLSRINRVDDGMRKVIESNFTTLLPVYDKEDEFQALTLKLNTMLRRIENLISGMRQVSDNIAHDLRSPLTRMKSRLEVTLLQQRDEKEYREVMHKVIDDCDELLRTFNSLLAITQAESGVFRDNLEIVDLTSLVNELAEFYRAVVEDSGLEFVWNKTDNIIVHGSHHSLAQAVNNLLENAIKYTPSGGQVTISVTAPDGVPTITIMDTGPGIPEKDRHRVLERFQRLDDARTKSGNGLGLSLVNAIVKLHHAELVMDDNNPGLIIKIRFPND